MAKQQDVEIRGYVVLADLARSGWSKVGGPSFNKRSRT